MKKLLFVICFFTFTSGYAQSDENNTLKSEAKVTSISYSVPSAKELENIDWKGVKDIFSENKDDVEIKMSFGIDLKKSKNKKVKVSGKFSVEGKSEDIDDLIEKAKKGIKGLVKLANKYEKK